ncbi:MAG TPA: site-2 protease family protein [Blastocatellia bacterium]|nr:site-2 protease family protein [Blastocatellia bacterium]
MGNINIGDLAIWFVVFLFSLSLHEAAHAWTSERFGDDTGRHMGRITLNPLPHIHPLGTIVFPLIGMLSLMTGSGFAMFGWAKPVMTNPLLWRDKTKANIMVSAAGPLSNFVLATIAFVALKSMLSAGLVVPSMYPSYFSLVTPVAANATILEPLSRLLSILLLLNITLGVFNLIPIPPLDGSHVLESLLPYEMAKAYEQIEPYGFILLIGLMFTGIFGMILNPIWNYAVYLLYT